MTVHSTLIGHGIAVRTNRFITFLAVVAIGFLALPVAAQKKAGKPGAGPLVPADSHFVWSFNIGSLLKKSGHDKIVDLPGMEEVHEELKEQSELAAKILEDPELLGIDFNQPIYVFGKLSPPEEEFGEPVVVGGMIASPLSAEKLETGMRNAVKEGLGEFGSQFLKNLKKEKNYSILTSEDMPAALAFNDDAFVVVGGNDEEAAAAAAEKLLRSVMAGKKKLSESEPTFASYLKQSVDLGGWMNLNALMELSPDIPEEQLKQMQELIGKLRMAGSVDFVPGGIRADALYSIDAEYMKKMKPAPKKTMLDLIPQNAVGSFAYAFDIAGTRKWMKEEYLPALKKMEGGEAIAMAELMMMGAIGMNFDDLMEIPKGEMVFSFIDLEMAVNPDFGTPEPKPSLVFGMTVNDMKKMDTLLKKLEEEGGMEAMNAAGFDILKQKDRVFIANNGLIPALRKGKMPNAVAGERRKFFEKNEQGVIVDFKQIVRLVQDFDAPNEVVQVLIKFAEMRFEANKKGDLYQMGGELTFRDAKTNGLKQLIKMAREIEQDIKLEAPDQAVEIEVEPDNR
jgi:hypothetical protein